MDPVALSRDPVALSPIAFPAATKTHVENAVVKRYMNKYCIKAAQVFVKFLTMFQISNVGCVPCRKTRRVAPTTKPPKLCSCAPLSVPTSLTVAGKIFLRIGSFHLTVKVTRWNRQTPEKTRRIGPLVPRIGPSVARRPFMAQPT